MRTAVSLIPNSSQVQPQHSLPAAGGIVKEENVSIPEQKIAIPPTGEELKNAYTQISRLSSQVQTNSQVKTAIEKHWANFPAALERLKIAVQENWRCNLTGVLVKALKEGVPSENAAPPCAFFGWKEWADEATKRRLMQYSESCNGDIMVHFVSGGQGLWSQLRSLSWSEVEFIASGGKVE